MIAIHLFSRDEVKERLDEFGCELVEEWDNPVDPYYQASYWRTSWGFHFVVPEIGPDRLCPEHRLYAILAELAEQKPAEN